VDGGGKVVSAFGTIASAKLSVLNEIRIEVYFDNMVAINLFHRPGFHEKLSRITSSTEATALLAAMISFAVRFQSSEDGEIQSEKDTHRRAASFLDLASKYNDDTLRDCGDNTPSLCLLQSFILVSHSQLTQGVLGRAWRTLGTCVRLAYETNLHLVDARGAEYALNSKRWYEDEEKRRAWWAIWEMDVFATTIRRTPTAVDWSQLETLLPVDDEHWFERKPTQSCFLQQDPILRWKALANSGSQSPKAWFIVINSLMKEAQRISSPRGIPNGNGPSSDRMDEARQRLEVIANAVHCFQLALPSHLKYQQQHLGFEARVHGKALPLRQTHCSIYNIYMMTQLARLMIYRYDVFKGRFRVALPTRDSDVNRETSDIHAKGKTERLAVNEYFEAADDMLTIIHRSSDDHIRYINPFLSNTIWLASAVHLMRSQLCRSGAVKSAVKSRYEVLHLTYKRCVRFWGMNTAVQQNLETLEEQLEIWQQSKKRCSNQEQNITSSPACREERSAQSASLDYRPVLSVPNTNEINTPINPTQSLSNSFYATDWQTDIPGDIRNTSALDISSVPSADAQFITDQMIPSATLIDPMFLFGSTQSQGPWIENSRAMDEELDIDWRYLQLPNELPDAPF